MSPAAPASHETGPTPAAAAVAPAPRISPQALLMPAAAYAGALLLHVDRVPPWCTAFGIVALLWRTVIARRGAALPPRGLRVLLALLLAAGTLLSYGAASGLAAGSALLVVMGGAKLLETRARRDTLIVTGTSMFLLLAAVLDRQSLLRLPLYAGTAWLGAAAFAALGTPQSPAPPYALRVAGRTLLLALPVALAAFLLFPRLPGPLWALPAGERVSSGLGEEMSPGEISELTLSDEPAFRVRFDGAPPPPGRRYWRGPVMHDFDGDTWRRGLAQFAPTPRLTFVGEPLRYHVALEPHGHAWWYGLDIVSTSPARGVLLSFDQQLLTTRPVDSQVSYDAVSFLQADYPEPLSQVAQRMDTRLPPGRNPRSIALARQLRDAAPDAAAFVQSALVHLRDGGYRYTLTPPRLDYDSVDAVLFDTRLGFCGHYASAYATLMRAGGVPARVVTGYLGGEWNPLGGYFIVRQSDAHAWTEVWLDGRGWVRVDPTAMVAPDRLDRGLRELPGFADRRAMAPLRPLFGNLLQAWDAVDTWWRERVVEFDADSQRSLFDRLGIPDIDYRQLTALLAGAALLWIAAVAWPLRPRRAPRSEPHVAAWRTLRQDFAAAGVPTEVTDGPLAFAGRAGRAFPDLAPQVDAVARQYAMLRYGEPGTADTTRRFGEDVARLRRLLRRRRPGPARRLPPESRSRLAREVPLYRRLPSDLQAATETLALLLLDRVHVVGCGGFVVDGRVRETIAVQAAVLVARRGLQLYAGLRSILVYPDEFVVTKRTEDDAGVVTEGEDVLAGQTEDTGRVLLSWRDIEDGLAEDAGYNVVVHEFAHLIDHHLDGLLSRPAGAAAAAADTGGAAAWQSVLDREYERLCDAVDAGGETLIDPYGAEDPAEFLAVATETFVGLPRALRDQHPELYGVLVELYGWTRPPGTEGRRPPPPGRAAAAGRRRRTGSTATGSTRGYCR